MKTIFVIEVEYVAHRLASELMKWDEPIPNFSTRFPHALESCLAVPFHTFGRASLYPGLVAKAAVLLYVMIKNHPFQNGNKRIAITTLMIFLSKNKKWLRVDNQQLYNFAKAVAQSDPIIKDEMIKGVEKFIKTYLVDLAEQK